MVGVDTDVTALRRLQTVLDALADGTAQAHGAAFFPALVRNFARALGVDRAFIAQCVDEPPTRVRTLARWSAAHGMIENIEFALAGTPCAAVVQDGQACFHPANLAAMFPREQGFEAYLGMPIVGSDGRVLGHLAFFDTRPRGDELRAEPIYRIFLARAAAELERRRAAGPTRACSHCGNGREGPAPERATLGVSENARGQPRARVAGRAHFEPGGRRQGA